MTVLLFLFLSQVTPELRQAVEVGMQARQAGNLAAAATAFRKVTELAPDLAAGHANLGAVYFEQREYAMSVAPLRRALELNPNLPGSRTMLGTALLSLGYAGEALTHLEASPELLGVALVEAGREREAIDKLEIALQAKPADPDLLYYLGQAHRRLAAKVFDKILASRDSARAAQLRAESAVAAGHRDVAVKAFVEALARRPDLRGMHLALGELALESGYFEAAAKEFAEEVRLSPGSARAAYRHGSVLANRGDVAGALRELRRADALQPDMPETLLELGKAELASGALGASQKAFEKVIALEPTSILAETAHLQLAMVYRRMNRPGDAERETRLFRELRAGRGK